MIWQNLFSVKRFGTKSSTSRTIGRSEFESDFDRVVFSSAFRRMQDKTQVVPLPESDFVHTRLTHSLEVSCVGRSLGKIVGEKILAKYPDLKNIVSASDFGSVVAAASLAHDIGNPPFGHSGERAISEYFINGPGLVFKNKLSEKEWKDLINFEGNANGFRILTNLNTGTEGGIKLTFTTLAAFTKYPTSSYQSRKIKNSASQKKYGFFNSEKIIFETIANELELIKLGEDSWRRHPLAFLVEAADDICYRIIDFEDGVRLGLIHLKEAETKLRELIKDENFDEDYFNSINDEKEQISYLRAKTINSLVKKLATIFIKHEEEILNGEFDQSLISQLKDYERLEEIKLITRKFVYHSQQVLKIESAGFNVIARLLDLFINAVNEVHAANNDASLNYYHSKMLCELLPSQYLGKNRNPDEHLYMRILRICDFVSGMTDSYAITLHRKLLGT